MTVMAGFIAKPTKAHRIWWVYWQFRGRRCSVTGHRSATVARLLLRNLERISGIVEAGGDIPDDLIDWIRRGLDDDRRNRLVRMGVLSPKLVASGSSLHEHLDAWKAYLIAHGRSEKYAGECRLQAGIILAGAKATTWREIDAEKVLAEYASIKTRTSARTAQAYLRAAKSFCRWAEIRRELGRSPLATVSVPGVRDSEIKRHRASLTSDQIGRLISETRNGPDRAGMTGVERALMYQLVLSTGLREASVMRLTRSSFNLSNRPPCVRAIVKGGKAIDVPIPPSITASLAAHLSHKAPSAKAFNCPVSQRWMLEVFQRDVNAAGIVPPDGKSIDFHALRTTCATRAAAAGVPIEVLQDVLGHTDIRVTRKYYVQVELERKASAMDRVWTVLCTDNPGTCGNDAEKIG